MRVIVHFGMPKSGSSALQAGLAGARPALLDLGILYPKAPVIAQSTNFLMAGLVPVNDLPRYLKQRLSTREETPERLFSGWRRSLRRALARHRVETLILSAENLFEITTPEPAQTLHGFLAELGATRIETVAYVRSPAEWYVSAAQQILRASSRVKPLVPVSYRPPLEIFARHVADPGAARVFAYDRSRFPRGDILAHFLQAVVGIDPVPFLSTSPGARQVNSTISAEGMALLQDYRLRHHSGENSTFTEDSSRFRLALAIAEPEVPGEVRPQLRPEVADWLNTASTDLLWLVETWGVRFDCIDMTRITGTASTPIAGGKPKRVDEICSVDEARKQALLLQAVYHLARGAPAMSTRLDTSG